MNAVKFAESDEVPSFEEFMRSLGYKLIAAGSDCSNKRLSTLGLVFACNMDHQ